MKERPILFSAPMVNAMLQGRKTQTRRVVKNLDMIQDDDPQDRKNYPSFEDEYGDWHKTKDFCPHGLPGDRLWVRETWRHDRETDHHPRVAYRADGQVCSEKWKPSIFMPRWACRINLEIKSVRCERLQEITEMDAQAEGAIAEYPDDAYPPHYIPDPSFKIGFRNIWDAINGKRHPWKSNPYVWVIEFERI